MRKGIIKSRLEVLSFCHFFIGGVLTIFSVPISFQAGINLENGYQLAGIFILGIAIFTPLSALFFVTQRKNRVIVLQAYGGSFQVKGNESGKVHYRWPHKRIVAVLDSDERIVTHPFCAGNGDKPIFCQATYFYQLHLGGVGAEDAWMTEVKRGIERKISSELKFYLGQKLFEASSEELADPKFMASLKKEALESLREDNKNRGFSINKLRIEKVGFQFPEKTSVS